MRLVELVCHEVVKLNIKKRESVLSLEAKRVEDLLNIEMPNSRRIAVTAALSPKVTGYAKKLTVRMTAPENKKYKIKIITLNITAFNIIDIFIYLFLFQLFTVYLR